LCKFSRSIAGIGEKVKIVYLYGQNPVFTKPGGAAKIKTSKQPGGVEIVCASCAESAAGQKEAKGYDGKTAKEFFCILKV